MYGWAPIGAWGVRSFRLECGLAPVPASSSAIDLNLVNPSISHEHQRPMFGRESFLFPPT
jgi:hypothetical protein